MSSRSGLVETKATGQAISSSMRRIYLIAWAGSWRQLRAPAVDSLQPAIALVDRLDRGLIGGVGGEMVERLAAQGVAGADPDLVEPVEHVELGQRDAGDARRPPGLADQHRVEPAAAALAPGHRAELAAALAEPLADLVLELGRERAGADPGRIGLDDAEHEAGGRGAEPGAAGGGAGDGVRRGDERIGAVIDVEQHALRAFEQDAAAARAAPR